MLFAILLLNFILLFLPDAAAEIKFSPEQGFEDSLENFVEKLVESRLRDIETRMQDEKEKQVKEKKELQATIKELATRLDELEESKLRMEEESSRKEKASNNALTKPSLRDLPIVFISAWRASTISSPQTVTFERFLANYNNHDRPNGGDGMLDLDSGVFTCITPGYYTVSFSASPIVGPSYGNHRLFLYKNGTQLYESSCYFWTVNGALNVDIGTTGSRIVVSDPLDTFINVGCQV